MEWSGVEIMVTQMREKFMLTGGFKGDAKEFAREHLKLIDLHM
jgi:hypothetical protein